MSYKQIKWMILILPTLVVGIWEYVRHRFLMPYISMDLGNYLTPVIVFLISMTLLNQLFKSLEQIQEELNQERAEKISLKEKDHLARELHDGIAQSLFLLSVQIDRAEAKQTSGEEQVDLQEIRKTVHEVNRYARQAIANLRYPVISSEDIYEDSMKSRIVHSAEEASIMNLLIQWNIPDTDLSSKQKVELLACIREALMNTTKHAQASVVSITGEGTKAAWVVSIKDNGTGIQEDAPKRKDRYGLRIMKERAQELGWDVTMPPVDQGTAIEIRKEDQPL
ncbi:sensor histidine kinase [Paenibacillus sp. IHBB 10380]|uniref:sensor histidine kinase n=1 Tax=Paenibacillus sp. IHBB 10380 TaxID=1566358 RepID=UPI0005CFEE02|nr:histidine kinase [Paenibacillus sp. IHBB 10380]AJS59042.1 histidine kinase [Paenibacillus sp. IHBB 10380]